MSAELCFVDTNVLVYLFDADSAHKQARARQLLANNADQIVLSAQVLGEFYVTVTGKLAKPLDAISAQQAVDSLGALAVCSISVQLVQAAVRRSRTSRLSYWDALIVETAIDSGASVLLTEDLQHGQLFDELVVKNPFLDES